MPKLLRLTSPEPQNTDLKASFECFLNDGINLKPFSKIGLKSLVLPIGSYITIDDNNNIFTLQPKRGGPNIIMTLTNGKYLLSEFINHFNEKIVDNFSITQPSQVGIQVSLNENITTNYAEIRYQRVGEIQYLNATLNNVQANGGFYQQTAHGNPQAGDSYAIENGFMLKGCCYQRTTVSVVGPMKIGLLTLFDDGSLTTDKMDYYIGINAAGNYIYYDADTAAEVDVGQAAVNNDILSVEVNNRHVKYVAYRDDGAGGFDPVFESQNLIYYDITTNFKPFIVLYNDVVRASIPRYLGDPNYSFDADGNIIKVDNSSIVEKVGVFNETLGVMPEVGSTQGVFTLSFSRIALARLLGFSTTVLQNNGSQFLFSANKPIDNVMSAKGIIIELPSIPQIESYDTSQYKRRPMLSVLPCELSYRNSTFTYETPHPLMLDISNSQPLLLRNMLVNIFIDADGEEQLCEVADQIEMVVILD